MIRARDITYTPDARDVLWMLRAVAAEGPPHREVAQTLLSGYLWARSELGVDYRLADWVRRYSQPVNPRWMPGGDLLERRLQRARESGDAARIKRELRKAQSRVTKSRRTQFPDHVIDAVQHALSHGTGLPVTDFAAWWVRPTPSRQPIGPATPNQNRFFTRDPDWSGYEGGPIEKARELVATVARRVHEEGAAAVDRVQRGNGGTAVLVLLAGAALWMAGGKS